MNVGDPGWALVLGGAKCVWRDLAALETMIGHPWSGQVLAVNDVGCVWSRPLHHWVTLHPEKLHATPGRRRYKEPPRIPGGWVEKRAELGHAPVTNIWTSRLVNQRTAGETPQYLQLRGWQSGSSSLLAVGVAYQLGCQRVVLAGVPMEDQPHFEQSVVHHPSTQWTAWRSHRRAWEQMHHRLLERTRSMSGWTRATLGAPSFDWLERGREIP